MPNTWANTQKHHFEDFVGPEEDIAQAFTPPIKHDPRMFLVRNMRQVGRLSTVKPSNVVNHMYKRRDPDNPPTTMLPGHI